MLNAATDRVVNSRDLLALPPGTTSSRIALSSDAAAGLACKVRRNRVRHSDSTSRAVCSSPASNAAVSFFARSIQLSLDHVLFAPAVTREERDHAVTGLCPGVCRHLLNECRGSRGSKCHQLRFHRTPLQQPRQPPYPYFLNNHGADVSRHRGTSGSTSVPPPAHESGEAKRSLVLLPDLPTFRIFPGFVSLPGIRGLFTHFGFGLFIL